MVNFLSKSRDNAKDTYKQPEPITPMDRNRHLIDIYQHHSEGPEVQARAQDLCYTITTLTRYWHNPIVEQKTMTVILDENDKPKHLLHYTFSNIVKLSELISDQRDEDDETKFKRDFFG